MYGVAHAARRRACLGGDLVCVGTCFNAMALVELSCSV
jgi:hypothetical protein